MSNAIQPLGAVSGSDQIMSAATRSSVKPGPEFAAAEPAAIQAPHRPNPALHIDGALGLVVIEFYDGAGKIASSIPTPRQLDAYRRSLGDGAAPATVGQAAGTGTVRPAASGTDAGGAAMAANGMSGPGIVDAGTIWRGSAPGMAAASTAVSATPPVPSSGAPAITEPLIA